MPETQPHRQPAAMPRFGARRRVGTRREPRLPGWAPVAEPARRVASAPRSRWPHWQALSALLHAALLAALLVWPDRRDLPPEPLPPPSFDVVFEGAQPARPAEPPPGIELPPLPPPGATTPSLPQPAVPPSPPVPPVVATPPVPPVAATPALEPPPAPPPTQPAQPAPPPIPTPPRLVEPVRPPQAVPLPPRIAAPAPPPPPPPQPVPERPPVLAEPARPVSPPPQPPAPQPARPQPAPTPPAARQTAPRPAPQPPALFLPDGFRLGEGAGRREGRGQAPLPDPRVPEGRASADPSVRVTGAQVGPDWRAAFRAWLDQNMRYPRRAAELGESGTVRVQVVAAPDGRVLSVRLTGPSTSPSLNIGTTFPFSGAQLPAFPPPADPNGVTIDLTVNYILIRR